MASWQAEARAVARRHGIDPEVFVALVRQESGGNQNAKSPAGAIGRTQLMPATAKGLGVDPRDPEQNLEGGAKYLRQQLDRFGSYRKALAAYNAGPGAVQKYGGVPPYAETQNYVKSILGGKNPSVAAGSGSGGSTSTTTTTTTPGVNRSGERARLFLDYLANDRQPNAFVNLALGLKGAQDTPAKTTTTPSSGGAADSTSAHAAVTGHGAVKIAPTANRAGADLTPGILKVVRSIAAKAGHELEIGTGTNHNRLTVNGNVSDHWSGNAADIPSSGSALTKLGQDALIAAGMDPAEARKQKGGLFNIRYGKHRRIQIIFNTNEGGNHFNHLHVGVTAK